MIETYAIVYTVTCILCYLVIPTSTFLMLSMPFAMLSPSAIVSVSTAAHIQNYGQQSASTGSSAKILG